MAKNLSANAGATKTHRFDPWVRKIPWRRKWQPLALFLPGKSQGQRSLAGCSPQGYKESDTTEQLTVFSKKVSAWPSTSSLFPQKPEDPCLLTPITGWVILDKFQLIGPSVSSSTKQRSKYWSHLPQQIDVRIQ